MNVVKRAYMGLYHQVRARKNLYSLRHSRTFAIRLGPTLVQAAELWPEVLPFHWKPQTLLDVGAYRGEIADQLAKLYRLDFAGLVEPLPHMIEVLKSRTFARRQKVFGCALGRTDGVATFHVVTGETPSSILEIAPECDDLLNVPLREEATIQVPMRTLDSIFAECELDDLDLLKVDVQGYEIEVFAGGGDCLRKTRIVVTEVSFFEHYVGQPQFAEVYDFLHSAGFELRSMCQYRYSQTGLPLQCDAVFMNRAMW